MAEALKDRSTEVEAQIGAVEGVSLEAQEVGDVSLEVRSRVAVEVADDGKERVLAPEVQAVLFGKLKQRFDANVNRHKAINWVDVQRSLEADPEKLWSLQEMEDAGHAPDVYMEDDRAYYFGTCSVETPEAHRNIVFDAEAQVYIAEHYPQEACNGNAVDIAVAMGIDLMDETQYRHLQTLGRFDAQTSSWLKTLDEIRGRDVAVCGRRYGESVYVGQIVASDRFHNGAFRGSLRVSKA